MENKFLNEGAGADAMIGVFQDKKFRHKLSVHMQKNIKEKLKNLPNLRKYQKVGDTVLGGGEYFDTGDGGYSGQLRIKKIDDNKVYLCDEYGDGSLSGIKWITPISNVVRFVDRGKDYFPLISDGDKYWYLKDFENKKYVGKEKLYYESIDSKKQNEVLNEINYMRKMAGKPTINENGTQKFDSANHLEKHLRGLAKNEVQFGIFKAYADKFDNEFGKKLMEKKFEGKYSDSKDFLAGAEFIKEHNDFNTKIAKKVVEIFGEDAKYRLAREDSVAVYVKDSNKVVPAPEEKYQPLKIVESSEYSYEGQEVYRLYWGDKI